MLSKYVSTNDTNLNRRDVKEINEVISRHLNEHAKHFQYNKKDFKITLPNSRFKKTLNATALIPRIFVIIFTNLMVFPFYLIASIWHNQTTQKANNVAKEIGCFDPNTSKNVDYSLPPLIFIHGSNANPKQWILFQWILFRRCLKGERRRPVFTISLSKKALKNDQVSIHEFANRLTHRIDCIQEIYKNHSNFFSKIDVLGHSMGGIIGGQYAVDALNGKHTVTVGNLVTMGTPWYGSIIANFAYDSKLANLLFRSSPARLPEGAFLTYGDQSEERNRLREELLRHERNGSINLYNYGSPYDLCVRPSSSILPIDPKKQWISNYHNHTSCMLDFKFAKHVRTWLNPPSDLAT